MMNKLLLKILMILSAIFIAFTVFTAGYILNLKSGIANNVLRLHIIGESDTVSDQNLKLKVRDRILSDYSGIFKECSNIKETIKVADEKLSKIEESAKDELLKYGYNKAVTATLSTCTFPTKTYEDVSLPAGKYTALNIKIGDGKGQNWWCVMYPPLCLTEGVISVPDSSKEKLKEVLTEDEYKLITNAKGFEIKFKIAEILGKYIK